MLCVFGPGGWRAAAGWCLQSEDCCCSSAWWRTLSHSEWPAGTEAGQRGWLLSEVWNPTGKPGRLTTKLTPTIWALNHRSLCVYQVAVSQLQLLQGVVHLQHAGQVHGSSVLNLITWQSQREQGAVTLKGERERERWGNHYFGSIFKNVPWLLWTQHSIIC